VPLKVISEKLKKDSYERTVLLSHDVKAEDGKVKDFVSYKTDIVNPTGMVALTIALCVHFVATRRVRL
ncbi:MAG: hypothetical protein IKX04_03885, partial [Clostridiales bacterium]|nr:hypothetical protein [Clostridiales bacterium]